MSGKTIATIYFYIISAASLALIVIGIFNAVNFGINSTQYDKYPLRYNAPGNCESYPYKGAPYPAMDVRGEVSTPSADELDKQKKACLTQEEFDRKQHKIDDIKNSITFTLVGIILFGIHFPMARSKSNS
ncbi:hypothetical protein A3J13_01360 [Candidatus Daviesbacteria bacterium RIFCSPLOWO2_02_FULL_36_8]|uniref:DUF5671 domain-containing protein n=2 Tax=Patescibacteria group TaxID=1783273 RepID=A0A1G2I4L5_9BACT|nr:MAG: hypothetical protein A3J13_01360 [Candidatus Daviesbacteria bacterium RIFCSPLOWO2_02_FULL_36_8]OGZ69567.1 MAG: hypothetical protein A3F47_01820 [Candidatus Staskawiczbacteria bacterium RIFCSPHIGHO2_12_FULL_38_11]